MDKKRVLVTGIGGNVGQGIVRNIKNDFKSIFVVGTNVVDFSAGNYLCDITCQVPYAYDSGYVAAIKKIVDSHSIDLVIPSTDFEVYYLSKFSKEINAPIIVSSIDTAEIFLDKYKTFLHHAKYDIPFADSILPSKYQNNFSDCIVKPREGRGSRGIYKNPENIDSFNDDEFLVQEMHVGLEITTAFYVDKSKNLHGFITLTRDLENGTTSKCRVVKEFDNILEPILAKLIKSTDIVGSANLQAIVNSKGEIIPFEINCRISGTNSIRSNFGFKDVKYTIQEHLFNEQPEKPTITMGVATRILLDVIYPNEQVYSSCVNNNKNYIF